MEFLSDISIYAQNWPGKMACQLRRVDATSQIRLTIRLSQSTDFRVRIIAALALKFSL
jgi:hypothetical protein